jgi:PAS domain S-box-containing protein
MKRILIVDDNEQNLYLLRTLLAGSGYAVESAVNGAEALQRARAQLPDMIISDVLMPVMDGFTLCRHWKQDERLKAIPFVVYTANYTDDQDEVFALKLGADVFIRKPAEPAELVQKIKTVLESAERKPPLPRQPELKDEEESFQLYSERLSNMLEKKLKDLEQVQADAEKIAADRRLLKALSDAQSRFILNAEPRVLFDQLLTDLLALTGSEYGFIGEILHDSEGNPYLRTLAISNIAWNEKWRKFYEENAPQGLEFNNYKTLFGAVITSGQPVISNDPANDPRSGGLPQGHPPLKKFLGLPFYRQAEFVGMVGIANRPNGYDEHLVEYLKPFLTTCTNMIEAVRSEQRRNQAEEALRESEARIKAIVDTAVDGIVTIDARGVVKSVNPAAETIFGYRSGEVIGQNVNILMPSPHREQHDSYIDNYLKTGKSKIIGVGRETVGLRKDGTEFPIRLAISDVRLQDRRLFTGIVRDITARKTAEAKLDEMLARVQKGRDDLLAIMNMLHLGIVTVDPGGRVEFVNETAQNIINEGHATIVGKNWTELLALNSEDRARLADMFKRPPQDRKKLETQLETHQGRRYWMEIEVRDDPRSPQRKLLVLYDMSEIYDLRRLLDKRARFHDLVGKSGPMQAVYERIQEVSTVDWTVLIEGETGTGKELVARATHSASRRKDEPFVAINCAGLADTLLTSQLFGHRRGAFTGAVEDQKGMFEVAHGGTLFLDEIGDISRNMQNSLLRVLEQKEITRVGETNPRQVDVRILAATHRNLNREVQNGNFRQDLLYRLRVARIALPPLRERREDIPLLVGTFLNQSRAATGKPVTEVSDAAMGRLMDHRWPGNVRELKSAVDFAVLQCKGSHIEIENLPPEIREKGYGGHTERILAALEQTGGSRTRAARLLGISRATFYRRLEKLGIDPSG